MTGMATRLAATKPSRNAVGNRAARADVAARATPARTKNHEPLASMLAVSSTRTAVIIPASAIEIRMAIPIGSVAQWSNTSSEWSSRWLSAKQPRGFSRPAHSQPSTAGSFRRVQTSSRVRPVLRDSRTCRGHRRLAAQPPSKEKDHHPRYRDVSRQSA